MDEMTTDIDQLLTKLDAEEQAFLIDCQERFKTIGRVVTVEGFCLEMCIRISDQITHEHEIILDHIDSIARIKRERVAVNLTKDVMLRQETQNETKSI